MSSIQREISNIAYNAWNNGKTYTVSELADELRNHGVTPGNGRGLYRQISTTYACAVEEDNQGIADCIANCFTDDDGNYAWKN
ncbi:MAG: hypothetical protein JJE49_09885 [Peptostreptococcaceae bacterium]|nr:hypothetical protein [Peptostreptococcaceae bacterium]